MDKSAQLLKNPVDGAENSCAHVAHAYLRAIFTHQG
jgi:hypothetical protein